MMEHMTEFTPAVGKRVRWREGRVCNAYVDARGTVTELKSATHSVVQWDGDHHAYPETNAWLEEVE